MKIKIIVLLTILILTSSGFGAIAQNNNNLNQEKLMLDEVPIWNSGESWTYKIDQFTYEYFYEGQGFYFEGGINDFTWTVKNVGSDTYELDFTGKLNCDYEIRISSSLRTFIFTGLIDASKTRFTGTLIFSKSNLNFQDISGSIVGITKVNIGNLPISIPLPFKMTFDSELTTDFPLFDFPLSNNKFWNLPSMDIVLNMQVGGIFGLIKMPIKFTTHYSWIPLAFHCKEKQSITVAAGPFDAWEIESTFFNLFRYYYSPEVKNIVKVDASLEYGSANGELISYDI